MIVLPFKKLRGIMEFLNVEPDVVDKLPSFLSTQSVGASMVDEFGFNKTVIENFYEEGRQLFLTGKPRPKQPNEDTGFDGPESAAYYGWMTERARRIGFISRWIGRSAPKGTPEYEKQVTKSILAMDAEFGLEGKYDFTTHIIPAKNT